MAFDWTKVEGYREDMTAEEKMGLLDNYEEPTPAEPKPGTTVPKSQFDKVASELASVKKQLRSRQTEEEQREADRASAEEAMKLELETLRKEKAISTHKAHYITLGYDEKLADEAANAMADGDTDTVFAIMKKHNDSVEKALRAKLLQETPAPDGGEDEEKIKDKRETDALWRSFGVEPPKE